MDKCKSEQGSIIGAWMQFNKIGDPTWHYVEFGCGQLALDMFFDFVKISNGKHLNTKLF
jgi:hypothetical protein